MKRTKELFNEQDSFLTFVTGCNVVTNQISNSLLTVHVICTKNRLTYSVTDILPPPPRPTSSY